MIQITFLERFLILRSVTSLLRLSMLHFNSVIENLAASSNVHKIVDTRLYISKKLAPSHIMGNASIVARPLTTPAVDSAHIVRA